MEAVTQLAVLLANPDAHFGAQLIGLGRILGWVFVASFLVWLRLRLVFGIRVREKEEWEGVDVGECGRAACPELIGAKGSAR